MALAGDLVAARHRVPWVMDVRDLWPAAAVGMGELEEGRGLRLAERLEARLYDRAAAIIAVTEPFREKIAQITDPDKIHVIPNGTTQFWLDAAAIDPDRAELGLPDDEFIWTFAGNIGSRQGLEAAIDAAGLLGAGFRLLIVGNGPARAGLERRARADPPATSSSATRFRPSEREETPPRIRRPPRQPRTRPGLRGLRALEALRLLRHRPPRHPRRGRRATAHRRTGVGRAGY